MKKIYVMSGISGSGKTYTRTHDPNLKDLPALDIADVYREHMNLGPRDTFAIFLDRIIAAMEEHDAIVVEAWFRPGSFQRKYLEYYAEYNGWEVFYFEHDTPVDVCKQRVLDAHKEIEGRINDPEELQQFREFTEARLRLLDLLAPQP